MSNLQHLFRVWTPCFSVCQTLQACVFGCNAKTDSSRVYRLEAVGSGAFLGTTKDLTPYFTTHRVFLGHGGRELTRNSRVPSSYTGPFVLLSIQFQGQIQYSLKNRAICSDAWNKRNTVVRHTGHGNDFVMQTLDGANVWNLEHEHGITHALWNPQGTLLACVSTDASTVYIWNDVGEQIDEFTHNHIAEMYAEFGHVAKWSPDGQRLAITCVDNGIHMILWEDRAIRSFGHEPIATPNWNSMCHHAKIIWDPTSSFVAVGMSRQTTVWNCDGVCVWKHTSRLFCRVLWHPTIFGEFCVPFRRGRDIKLTRYKILDNVTKTAQVEILNNIRPKNIYQSCCGTLAFRDVRTIWIVARCAPCFTVSTDVRVVKLVWHPRKEVLGVIVFKTIYLWNVHGNYKLVKLCECSWKYVGLYWNPQGTLLACQTNWTRIEMYRETGTFCKTIVTNHPIQDIQWSADGQTLQVRTSVSIEFWT